MLGQVRLAVFLGLLAAVGAQDAAPPDGGGVEGAEEPVANTTRPPLTGNPQIDYKYDPNLPHELIGYDLSDYPFYKRLPKDLLDPKFNFTCDGRHDGFYASIPHKCQVYHNCLFGQRYDFLCANYTVFDQKNFICHYVSEVDCKNSEKHYDRNDDLYETTTTTTTTIAPPQIVYVDRPRPLRGPGRIRPKIPRRPSFGGGGGKRGLGKRRPGGRRRTTTTPPPEYYDYYDYYYDQEYDYYGDYANEEVTTTTTTTTARPRRRPNRPRGGNRPRVGGGGGERRGSVGTRPRGGDRLGGGGARPGGGGSRQGGGSERFNSRDRLRSRINPAEEEPSDPRGSRLQEGGAQDQETVDEAPQRDTPSAVRRRRPSRPRPKINLGRKQTTTTTTTTEAAPDYYYYEDYYDYLDKDQDSSTTTTTTTTTAAPVRRSRPSSIRTRVRVAAETETATEGPTGSGAREGPGPRVSVRKIPVTSDRVAPQDEAPVQRHRPRFPSRRGGTTEAPQVNEEAEALATDEGVDRAAGGQEGGQPPGGRRGGDRRPGRRPTPKPDPEYYYYDY